MSIRGQAISGVKWTTVSTITITVVNLLKISVLTRFLDKSDFGLMALVTFVLGFMNLFIDMGLTSAILHKQNISRNEYASLYWINVIFSIIIFVLILLVSPIIAKYYNETELTKLIPLMGLSIILSAIGRQFRVIEQKELHFKNIALIDVISGAIGLVVSVILAVRGAGVYALVYGALTIHLISNFYFLITGIYVNGLLFHFRYSEAKPFLKIGIFQVGGQIVNYFNRDLDILIIGKVFGTEILGGYSLAKQLVRRPLQIIDPIINRVGISIFPRFQDDNEALKRHTTNLLTLLGGVNGITYGLIAILASPLVFIFYGADYLSITLYVQLFAGLIYLRSMGNTVGILVITKGRTDLEFYWNILTLIIFPPAILLASTVSLETVIISMIIIQISLLFPAWHMFFRKLVNMNIKEYLLNIITPIAIITPFVILSSLTNTLAVKISIGIFISIIIFLYLFKKSEDFNSLVIKYKNKYGWF